MSFPFRIGLLGSGRMGAIRATHLYSNPRALLTSILDVNEKAASKLASTYGINSINDTTDIQGLVVSSPTHTHLDAIKEAPDGIPIFLEKPIAEDAKGIREGEKREKRKEMKVKGLLYNI